jgi:FkbM family methyltransferase
MMQARQKRPRILSISPLWLRESLAYRVYLRRINEFKNLFFDAELHFAPGVRLDLLPTDVGHAIIALTGLYETEVSRRVAALARSGGRFIDVGANYGYYTCLWVGANDHNMSVAVEASPRNVGPLIANIHKNRFDDRVVVCEVAAGKEDGFVGFINGSEEQTGWGGVAAEGCSNDLNVPCMRIDKILGKLGWDGAEAMKVDVEGADVWVLEGALSLLSSHRIRHIFFEENPARMKRLGINKGSAQHLLKRLGYSLERLTQSEWYAIAPS